MTSWIGWNCEQLFNLAQDREGWCEASFNTARAANIKHDDESYIIPLLEKHEQNIQTHGRETAKPGRGESTLMKMLALLGNSICTYMTAYWSCIFNI